ncbi:thioredoxin-dependent thiol peroxidase [Chlamydiales bacterium]|nr:thioredoxin-dependent thiol peroxidase [Chlamydiales bacterium]
MSIYPRGFEMANEYKVNVGDQCPVFTLKDQNGNTFVSDELFEAPAIIYFYPRDDTPGCTKEACEFRDALERFNDLEVRVLGISTDSVESHKKFSDKYELNFSLLSDEDHQVAEAFDVWQSKMMYGLLKKGVIRATFIIDGEGTICFIERPAKVNGQVERLLSAVREYANIEPQE